MTTITAPAPPPVDTETPGRDEVTTRPSWLIGDCPVWCIQTHREDDFFDDRNHWGADAEVAKSLTQTNVFLSLIQHYREVEPRVALSAGNVHDVEFTPAEAEALAAQLLGLAKLARSGRTAWAVTVAG